MIRGALPWTVGLVGRRHGDQLRARHAARRGLVAWRRGSWLDNLLPAMTFFQAAPYFFVAFLAVDAVRDQAGLVPAEPGYEPADLPGPELAFVGDVLDHAVLPALTIVLCVRGGLDRRHAQHDGDHDGRGLRAGRPGQGAGQAPGGLVRGPERASCRACPGFSLAIGFVVSGALLTEIVFSYPGRGLILRPGGRQPRLPAAPGHLPDHHVRRAARQPGRRLRVRVPRPADPAGGLTCAALLRNRRRVGGRAVACPACSG